MYCKYPDEVCANMTLYQGKIYCNNQNNFCSLHDEISSCDNDKEKTYMSKSVLIIDTPASCSECPLFFDSYTDMCCQASYNRTINYPYPKDFKQDWCPLKPVPDKYDVENITCDRDYDGEYEYGYNACIDEILEQ